MDAGVEALSCNGSTSSVVEQEVQVVKEAAVAFLQSVQQHVQQCLMHLEQSAPALKKATQVMPPGVFAPLRAIPHGIESLIDRQIGMILLRES